jgi:hypothetical protein
MLTTVDNRWRSFGLAAERLWRRPDGCGSKSVFLRWESKIMEGPMASAAEDHFLFQSRSNLGIGCMLSGAKAELKGLDSLSYVRGAEPTWEPKKTSLLIAELMYMASI